jgi:hypothetical protein
MKRAPRISAGIFGGATLGAVALASAPFASAADAIPDFSPNADTGWQLSDDEFIPPPMGPGPVTFDPAHPYISFYRFPRNPNPTFRVADLSNPILQPWAREALKKVNDRSLAGKYVAIPKERCWPVGVPAVYFLQQPKTVTMIWTQDHQVRHVYLNATHSAKPKPTWFGESIGHYEGDTLVVDTIGLSTKTFVDNYQTPHTEQLHVIERYRMVDDGKTLEVNIHVEDPGAFTTPWNAIQRYRRTETGPMPETVCAENNDDHFNQDMGPIPVADRPDF